MEILKSYPTPKGGLFTVLSCKGSKVKGTCTICSVDKELFPEEFTTSYKKLAKGTFPCACTLYHWSKRQYHIKVIRECVKKNYTFVGYLKWDGRNTKLKLKCNKDSTYWETTIIKSFLKGCGCKSCQNESIREARTIPDKTHIFSFMSTGKFLGGTVFIRDPNTMDPLGKYPYWFVTCPVCEKDEYTVAGVSSGTFRTTRGALKKGHLPCRCNESYRWNTKEREYSINKRCIKESLSFIGWEESTKYSNCTSRINWKCSKGHSCTTVVDSFLNGLRGCLTCRDKNFQYYIHRKNDTDHLYWILLRDNYETFVKVGRAFNLKERFKVFTRGGYTIFPLKIIKGTHESIVDLEMSLHGRHYLVANRETSFIGFDGGQKECYNLECIPFIEDYLQRYKCNMN